MSKKVLKEGLEKVPFKADDVSRLLRVAARSNVKSIRWDHGALEVQFFAAEALPPAVEGLPMARPVPADPKQAGEITRQALADEEEVLKQAELDELMLRDPVEYEQRVIDGSLVDVHTRDEETADDR